MSSSLVSAIATFYNVEEYADDCVNSLVHQTYPCEIVLVNDGSTDKTLEILKKYADCYDNVILVDKKNGGVADARNVGVKRSQGKYITFIDGDDMVCENYIEVLINGLLENNADIAVAGYQIFADKSEISADRSNTNPVSVQTVSTSESIDMLMLEIITESPWGKIADRCLYESHPFPVGRSYEDVAIITPILLECKRIAVIQLEIYLYRMRTDSVVHKINTDFRQIEDFKWAIDEMLLPVETVFPGKVSYIKYRRMVEYLRLHTLIRHLIFPNASTNLMDDQIIKYIQTNKRNIVDLNYPKRNKIRFNLISINVRIYDFAFGIYEWLKKGIKR